MDTKFTRIEFEGDCAIVVTALNNGEGYLVRGNQLSGFKSVKGFNNLSHTEVVSKVIDIIGRRVKRNLTHFMRS